MVGRRATPRSTVDEVADPLDKLGPRGAAWTGKGEVATHQQASQIAGLPSYMDAGMAYNLARRGHLVVVSMLALGVASWQQDQGFAEVSGRQDRADPGMRHD